MQGNDMQIMQLYQAFMHLINFASLVMFAVVTFVVFINGRSSTERTLIGIGAVLQAISTVVSLGMFLFQKIGQARGGEIVLMYYAISNLISFVGVALGLYGAVKLLNRTAQMELLLEDPDDDR